MNQFCECSIQTALYRDRIKCFVRTQVVPVEGETQTKTEQDLIFSQCCSWKFKYYVILRRVDWYTVPDVSGLFTASIFRGHTVDNLW